MNNKRNRTKRKERNKLELVIADRWTEYERGWGQRRDGVSIHRTFEDYNAFVADYWKKNLKSYVPDEYSREDGQARAIYVEAAIAKRIGKENGAWLTDYEYYDQIQRYN